MQNRIETTEERMTRLTRRRPQLVATATRQLGSSALAEDVVQDALMVVLLEKHHTLRDEQLDKYLYGIIRNKCRDLRRRSAQRQRALDRMRPTSTLDADPTASASSRQLLQCISPKARSVVERRLEGCSFAEIAELLNVTVEAARRRHCDAMKTLRALLDSDAE
jgi:RNA polymerase sigma-70 factor (ECF subfamily)